MSRFCRTEQKCQCRNLIGWQCLSLPGKNWKNIQNCIHKNPDQQLFAIDETPLYLKDFVWLWGKERSPDSRINDVKAQVQDLVGKSKLEAAIKILGEENFRFCYSITTTLQRN